jgi:para-nitrobenzyl esterase
MVESQVTATEPSKATGRRQVLAGSAAALFSVAFGAKSESLSASDAPIAKTKYGLIRGARVDGVQVLKGVPYGAPTADQTSWPHVLIGVRHMLKKDEVVCLLYRGLRR